MCNFLCIVISFISFLLSLQFILTNINFSFESTALRLITSLGSSGVQLQMSRVVSEPKSLVSSESEELNRVLVLTLARGIYMTGAGMLTVF